MEHLDIVFKHLLDAGLTLWGMKCHFGVSKVQYLGHEFSDAGMSPDPERVQVIVDWPIPANATEVHTSILGTGILLQGIYSELCQCCCTIVLTYIGQNDIFME